MTKTGEVWGKKFYSRIYTKPAGRGQADGLGVGV
jgi:hypothetical protein